MSRQYLRDYELIVISSKSKSIKELRLKFEITKSSRSYPNIARLELFNPNQETVNLLTEEDSFVIFNAGYKGNLGLIFKGKTRNVFSNKIGTERVLTIYAADGDKEWQEATYNKALSENLKLKDVVLELFSSLTSVGDLSIGELKGLESPADKLRGQVLTGSSKDILDKLANDYNFEWSIQDGELITTEFNKPDSSQAILVKQSTGMIGSPTLTEIGAEVTTLLNPKMLPNRRFKIESESTEISVGNLQFRDLKRTEAEGLYRAYEVIFTGDTRGESWYSTAKGTFYNE